MAETSPIPPANSNAKCPHCDHVFVPEEITDEWCAGCGKHIPEALLKEIRPKPHILHPHPHPLPEPTPAEKAEAARKSKTRAFGFLLMLFALALASVLIGWAVYCRLERTRAGSWVVWVGGAALAVFIAGLGMLITGRRDWDS